MTKFKYHEEEILDEIREYLGKTYGAHYAGSDNVQAMDLIASGGMLMHFSASSIIKYAFRFGKKEGLNRKDLLKIIHYAMFMLWDLDKRVYDPLSDDDEQSDLFGKTTSEK